MAATRWLKYVAVMYKIYAAYLTDCLSFFTEEVNVHQITAPSRQWSVDATSERESVSTIF